MLISFLNASACSPHVTFIYAKGIYYAGLPFLKRNTQNQDLKKSAFRQYVIKSYMSYLFRGRQNYTNKFLPVLI